MRRPSRSFALLLAAALGAAACDSTGPDDDEAADPLLVSEPIRQPASVAAGEAAISASVVRHDMEDINAFVSLAPGSYPDAIVAEVVNRRLARSVPAPIVDGGFDPVGIPAAVGDTVIVNITGPGGELVSIRGRVPARRPPRVVRTYPRPGRTDIAFNAIISAVFSEPVDPASIDQTSMRLSETAGPAVEGTVRLSESALGVEFVPDYPLLPGREYRLLVMRTVRDLSGDPLEVQTSLDFTTEGTVPGNSVVVTSVTSGANLDPDGYRVIVDGSIGQHAPVNGSMSIPGLPAGTHSVSLTDLSGNCFVEGEPVREVALGSLDTVTIDFAITCQPVNSIVVSTTTSGSDPDSDGYQVQVESGFPESIGSAGTQTLTGVAFGEHTVILTGVKGNCSAVGSLRQEVVVVAGQAATASFDVICAPDFRPAGVIAYARSGGDGSRRAIHVANADGSGAVQITDGLHFDSHPAWSPDGTRLAFSRLEDGVSAIYVVNADGSNLQRRTVMGQAYFPAWSPDGTRIVYNDENGLIYASEADGDWTVRLLLGFVDEWSGHPAWAPDGATIAFIKGSFDFGAGIHLMNADGSNLRPLVADPLVQYLSPKWSRDGQSVVAVAASSPAGDFVQRQSIVIVSVNGQGLQGIATTALVEWPAWSPDEDLIAARVADCAYCEGRVIYLRPDGRGSSVTIDGAFDPAWQP